MSIDGDNIEPLPWPEQYTGERRFPNNHILWKSEPLIWSALAHASPELFKKEDKEKQIALRAALNRLGLGWVGTNNTQLRMAVGALYDEARSCYLQNSWRTPKAPLPSITPAKINDVKFSAKNGDVCINGTQYTNTHGEWNFQLLKSVKDKEFLPLDVARKINSNLEKLGMDIIRGAVNKPTVELLSQGKHTEGCHPNARPLEKCGNCKKLSETAGSGMAGDDLTNEQVGSHYIYLRPSDYLKRLQKAMVVSLSQSAAASRPLELDAATNEAIARKHIMLRYSTGGENWAHSDAVGTDFPFQALLMLSNSDEYDGGEFYVAKQDAENNSGEIQERQLSITRLCTPKLNSGDLVIFASGGKYCHGMKTVTSGERIAVGLLQGKDIKLLKTKG